MLCNRMGVEKGMADRCSIRLYTAQTDPVLQELKEKGVCHCREAYVRKKYAESAEGFLIAYRWLAANAPRFVPKPDGAELMYWAFPDKNYVTMSHSVLALDVPREQVLLFDYTKWSRILQLNYIGASPAHEARFSKELSLRGISAYTAMTTDFYPEMKQRILESWQRLFEDADFTTPCSMDNPRPRQAALWEIRREWVAKS